MTSRSKTARVLLSAAATSALLSAAGAAGANVPDEANSFEVVSDHEIIIDGVTFDSWQAVFESGYFYQDHTRCATDEHAAGADGLLNAEQGVLPLGSAADCSANNTNPGAQYDPSVVKYRIPVVFHVISNTSGTGDLSDERVHSQIEILNEDFLALPGTNGAPGTDVQIEFYLADEDPDGNPSSGIVRTVNNTWFNDSGSYWNTLSWDTDRYLNFYSNSASGALGYVPGFPASGIAGASNDRVVVLYSTVGRNAPLVPFHLGRTGTHEIGHYLGLYHTFQGGCAGGNCNTRGDLICDTNDEGSPTFGCPGNRISCGQTAPFHNYMDYADDICMWEFTPNQARRMRCTLENWRPNLYEIAGDQPCSAADIAEPLGTLDVLDVTTFLTLWNNSGPGSDFDNNGTVNVVDVVDFITLWNQGCP